MSALVYPHFIGRLGNNMFQIAACIGYAKKYGIKWGVQKGYVEKGFNAFQVDKYFPNLPEATTTYRAHQEHRDNSYCLKHRCGLDECWFNHHNIEFYPAGIRLMGFFQSWKYFDNAKEEVREAFPLKEYPELKDYVSIHVRRGDYLQNSGSFPPVTIEYVHKAINKIWNAGFAQKLTKFYVFSDDLQWCKDNIKDSNGFTFKFSEGRNEYEDLCMMASCSHNIISNSTLAWWAAWLNKNPDKIVVSPSCKRGNWFGLDNGVKQDCVDLLPPEWIQIEFR